ncbi:DUF4278 domain-containing protein [Kovacikia minuta CCNUW1]|uniref:DUF4278 domain-containing protein n=1 Tax=Kovacikia minuta TaxID=2931930 RepID=UPI001CCC46CD|nr:DUF4278 domain-containing protein [Kovacikia minuta]UBF25079.1 DUF4278 domain-containing protein [Kovacikia minuta CCNUW1]
MQLTYRGQSYNFESTPDRSISVAGPHLRALQYRGNTYTAHISNPQSSVKPRAINWRYEVQ